ncbi:MAG: flagellar basal body L-ring protein FlgH [Proteobacteria bacterium]|nr:flagellar basal body L-ring protein FlgH [Pseudomonadota bacterium]
MATLVAAGLSGCGTHPSAIGRAPTLSAIGSAPPVVVASIPPSPPPSLPISRAGNSAWIDSAATLFRDARAMRVGDVITVKISIKDKAVIDNTSNRSRESSGSLDGNTTYDVGIGGFKRNGSGSGSIGANSKSSSTGKGGVTRSESIELLVAAVVQEVLPNGNLLIQGTQEVRVNFEMRELTVAGIVRARDVATDNTISYDRIAEARISYGGNGRIMEVQQPAWGQQILDAITPF